MIKHILNIFLFLFSINISSAQTFIANGITYKIIKDADETSTFGTVHVTASEGDEYSGDIIIPNGVQDGEGEFADQYKVTGIDEYAFSGNTSVESIELCPSIEYLAANVFKGCTNLQKVTIPYGPLKEIPVMAFAQSGIIEIDIPKSIEKIGGNAFFGCTRLESITLPNSLREISYGAFYLCTSLSEITIPDKTIIKNTVFGGCSSLKNIRWPASQKRISGGVFSSCTSLEEIIIPEGVTEIGEDAFSSRTTTIRK